MGKIISSGRRSGDDVAEAPPDGDTSADELDMVLPVIGGRRVVLEDRYEAGLNDRPKLAISIFSGSGPICKNNISKRPYLAR